MENKRLLYLTWELEDDGYSCDFLYSTILVDDTGDKIYFETQQETMDFIQAKPSILYVWNTQLFDWVFSDYFLYEDGKYDITGTGDIELKIRKITGKKTKRKKVLVDICSFTKLGEEVRTVEDMRERLHHHIRQCGSLDLVPQTISQYGRRPLRDAAHRTTTFMRDFRKNQLDVPQYDACKEAFHGGCNIINEDWIAVNKYDCYWRDFNSHYTTQLMKHKLPIGYHFKARRTEEELRAAGDNDDFEYLVKFRAFGIKKKPKIITYFEEDYIDSELIGNYKNHRWWDTNTAVEFKYMTAHDFSLFCKHFEYERLEIINVYACKCSYLPDEIINLINEFYIDKYKTKVEKKLHEGTPDEAYYSFLAGLAKTKLQAISYGEWARDPLKFVLGSIVKGRVITSKEEALNKHYSFTCNFAPYWIGVAITAWARHELYEYVDVIGHENVGYGDTDSLIYRTKAADQRAEKLNAEKRKFAPFATYKGEKFYYDNFELERRVYVFKVIHKKCYAYIFKNGKTGKLEFKIKVAGVLKEANGWEREDELLSFEPGIKPFRRLMDAMDRFKVGFTFNICAASTIKQCEYLWGYVVPKRTFTIKSELENAQDLLELRQQTASND